MVNTHANNPPQHPTDPSADAGTDAHTAAMVQMARLWASAMPSVHAFVSASVRDVHDREDVIQATGEFLARNFDQFEPGTSFVAWAVAVAKLRIKELVRDRSRDRLVLNSEAIDAVADAAVDLRGEQNDRQGALSRCMQQLGDHQRRLLEMRYTQALTPATIAEKIGKSANAVSAALMRIRTALHKCIDARLRTADNPSAKEGETR